MVTMPCRSFLLAITAFLSLVPQLLAQSNSNSVGANPSTSIISAANSRSHYTWIEEFDGSADTDGQVMVLDSSFGYVFSHHLALNAGLPLYFVRVTATSPTGTSTNNSFTALGDIYAQVRLSFPNPTLNYRTQFTGRAPTGSSTDGISTGHPTYDWTNRIDRRFGAWTPFFEIGLADSIPDAFVYRRPFTSYGQLSHFQLGVGYHLREWLTLAASAFDIAPWGSQTIFSRIAKNGPAGSGGQGRGFEQNAKMTGGSGLAADNGFSAGVVLVPSKTVDFMVGYSRSTHYQLNTISFGIAVNMAEILRRSVL